MLFYDYILSANLFFIDYCYAILCTNNEYGALAVNVCMAARVLKYQVRYTCVDYQLTYE